MDDPVLAALIEDLAPLTRRFSDAGYRLYLVGGAVRDLMLGGGRPGEDLDLTTDAPPDVIRDLLAPIATALWTQGERFGTIGARVAGQAVEVTTHRAESYASDSRKPQVSFGTDLTVDLSRRDFTVNAMARALPSGELVDPFGGARDLAARRLRTPLDPVVSFTDDPLRMLRAARFAARLHLDPDPAVVAAATRLAERISIVSAERIHDELERLLAVADPTPGLGLLADTGLLAQVLPEVATAGAEGDPRFGRRRRLDVALAALGGAAGAGSRRVLLGWPVAEDVGAEGVDRLLGRLRYSGEDRRATASAAGAVVRTLRSTEPAEVGARRLVVDLGPLTDVVVSALSALRPLLTDPALAAQLDQHLEAVAGGPSRSRLEPPLDGRAVMGHLRCGPGPVVGDALAWLRQRIIEVGPMDADQARDELERWWAARSR